MTSTHPKSWWWIALNRGSCAACPFPMPAENLRVAPVPEHLIGFRSNEEQLSAQDFVLKATTIERDGFVQALAPLIDAGEVAYIQPDNPELPAQKEILWRVAKGDRLRDRTSY